MAVPKKKTSKSRTKNRRSHHALSLELTTCSQCKGVKIPHIICPSCGYYGGKAAKEIKK
ncbi:MAG: 50S ribosomal protein L32 [candidate division CPR2 bacterium GW2011_GWC1_39_9]|uniref:Large ribosomal subunit protein bL32 n=1 Tax=candidate division CPR2 bacterium GW2011_GWC2_39_10 TaxID=1618345 RepID=A0A0G0LQ78_UNCC2|nr:MAG: 50S ribosomal protein L32 [candidate division CPR2 bacterium GW2011_GWC2_39_10]KKR33498.1 MAG: 50S ribosomal protein L32 [candidate division CPR2 bacterium GW2011_GWC1_39_9]